MKNEYELILKSTYYKKRSNSIEVKCLIQAGCFVRAEWNVLNLDETFSLVFKPSFFSFLLRANNLLKFLYGSYFRLHILCEASFPNNKQNTLKYSSCNYLQPTTIILKKKHNKGKAKSLSVATFPMACSPNGALRMLHVIHLDTMDK